MKHSFRRHHCDILMFLGDLIVGMKTRASLLVNINIQIIKVAGKIQLLKRSTKDLMACQKRFDSCRVHFPSTIYHLPTPHPPLDSDLVIVEASPGLYWSDKILLFSRAKQEK